MSFNRLRPIVIGLIVGAFTARLALEVTARPWPPFLVVLVAVLLMGIAATAAWRLAQPTREWRAGIDMRALWPLLLLGLYLIWPRRQPSLAALLLILVILTAILEWLKRGSPPSDLQTPQPRKQSRLSAERMTDLITFALSLALYIVTTAPDVLPADSGEFQTVAPLLGIAHPPGYPLYTLLGWLFTRLIPFGNEAYRLNLLSAFFAAGTLTLVGAATRRWARKLGASTPVALVGGTVAALTLGSTTTFWAQGTVANIRMPTMFAAALGFYAVALYADAADQRQADRALVLLALALGLGIGHHPSLVFLAVFLLLYLVLTDPRLLTQPRRWWKPFLVALLALLPLLYLPLRGASDARFAPPDLDTLDGFIHHVTAQGFEGDMFAYANAHELPQRLILLPTLFLFQFNRALLAAAVLGLLLLVWRDQRLLVLLAGGLILHTFVSITYRAPQTVEYLMPAYLPSAVLAGLTVALLLSSLRSGADDAPTSERSVVQRGLVPVASLVAATVIMAALVNGTDHGPSYFALARDRSTRAAMESILDHAPPDALILANWHWATPLWYLQWVEGQRPDVEVRYVFPVPGQEIGETWQDLIEAADTERPLLLTRAYDLPDHTLEPLGQGYRIHRRPQGAATAAFTPVEAIFAKNKDKGSVRLLGYHLTRDEANPGQALELTIAWQAVSELTTAPSFTLVLTTPEGQRLTAADKLLGTSYTPGEMRFERLVLPLYPNIAPGEYDLTLQVYSAVEEGFETWSLQPSESLSHVAKDTLSLATLSLHANSSPMPTLQPLSVPFKDGPMLVGVDYDRSVLDTLRLYLHWRGPAQGREQIHVGESTVQLSPLEDDEYQTLVLDLSGETQSGPHLSLLGVDGEVISIAGPWGWPLREFRLPTPSPTARFVPLADEMALIGVSPSDMAFSPGDELPLRLTFLSLKPLVDDSSVSVRLLDQDGQWRYLHDIQPALGTIPTLKWIRGSQIMDPHPLPVPNDITGEIIKASLVVYERFRGTPRPALDSRMAGVPLGSWGVVYP